MRSWMAKRLRSYTDSVFEEVTALARRYDAVNLGSGTPDLPMPEPLQAAVADAIVKHLKNAGVAAIFGMPGGGSNLDIVEAAGHAGLAFVLTATETGAAERVYLPFALPLVSRVGRAITNSRPLSRVSRSCTS